MDANVKLALQGSLPLRELTIEQQESYLDQLEELMLQPSQIEEDFFADRRRRGVGVGMDEDGNFVFQRKCSSQSCD